MERLLNEAVEEPDTDIEIPEERQRCPAIASNTTMGYIVQAAEGRYEIQEESAYFL